LVALWILGVLLALILLVLFLRVGVYVSFGEELRVRAKAGPVTIQILPKPEKKPKKKKPKKEKKKKKKKPAEKPKEKEKKKLGITFEDIRTVVPALFESLKKGLRKTRKRLKIDPMRISVSFGGEDPSKVAQMFGWTDAAMWTFMPQIERLTRMPDPRIHLDADYERGKTLAEGEIGLSLQIRDIFAIGFAFGIPLVKWLLGFIKRKKAREAAAKKAAEADRQPVTDTKETTHHDKGE
jgi:hypothetical protein